FVDNVKPGLRNPPPPSKPDPQHPDETLVQRRLRLAQEAFNDAKTAMEAAFDSAYSAHTQGWSAAMAQVTEHTTGKGGTNLGEDGGHKVVDDAPGILQLDIHTGPSEKSPAVAIDGI